MVKAFLFDIGNVILRFDFAVAMRRLAGKMDPVSESVMEMIEPLKLAYESGQIPRAEFLQKIGEVIRYTGTEPELISAWEEIFTENFPMTELIQKLHGRYPLYLLSNTSDLHVDYMLRMYPVFRLFDEGVYSYRAGCCKPGREIFEVAVTQLRLTPSETVFIDDLAPNIATARELGFRAIQYDHENHASLLAELEGWLGHPA